MNCEVCKGMMVGVKDCLDLMTCTSCGHYQSPAPVEEPEAQKPAKRRPPKKASESEAPKQPKRRRVPGFGGGR